MSKVNAILLITVLFSSTCSAALETVFQCKTNHGFAILEKSENRYLFSFNNRTCILPDEPLQVNRNNGNGYDSWETNAGTKDSACNYAIEYVDNTRVIQYTIVQFGLKGMSVRYPCSKASVIDHISDMY